MDDIMLSELLELGDLEEFKAHCAVINPYGTEPLDAFARDRDEWHSWNMFKGQRDDFNRPYIFSMMRFYHEADTWLFGGIYKVHSFDKDGYKIELLDKAANLIGRLKLRFTLSGRTTRLKLENYFSDFVVSEILAEPYTGQRFPGFRCINVSFEQLQTIFRVQNPDWLGALQNIKGVYLITDTNTGKRYVGMAKGESGVWSRWSCYLETGHGEHSKSIKRILKKNGLDYARKNFRFALLDYFTMQTEDQIVMDRETYWKEVLLTRGKWGYNLN